MPMTMDERYDHAIAVMRAYSKTRGASGEPGLATHYEISYLICDLLHLTASKGFHKHEVLETAFMHYKAEHRETSL
jgi:hypothetical protein